jgi:hypothetical protein
MEEIIWSDSVRYEVLIKNQGGEEYFAQNRKDQA